MQKSMIIPGNGGKQIAEVWYPYVKDELRQLGIDVIATDMPDPELARAEFWLPFIAENVDEDSILIGYSSGAVAALRYLEKHRCSLLILIGVYHTDLDLESERQSGYFDTPWQWEKVKENVNRVVIFASKDDPYIPIEQPQFIKGALNAEYHEYIDEGHFGSNKKKTSFPEVVTVVKKFLGK